ncbi:MAG: DUF1926 domain-containing protein [Verrucomicrobia bacterium]|nr:DUF1926 domain-containing protein [Verrucomicrobiota bacterium]
MNTINFLFGIHNHQPVGNFDGVFRQAYEECYAPLLERLERHPSIRCALHHSGPLIEWIESNEPAYIDRLGELVERGQVEIMSGGFYEPILTVIPRDDALGQIAMMNDWVEARFGHRPRGLWCAERIWEPQLAGLLAEAGIDYTVIDESHFTYSGLTARDMFGYYVTEDNGAIVRVFPIDKTLRYSIPFKMPEVTIDYLRGVADESETKAVTLGDDGEKFGVWPGTHKWVYTDGYLDNLFGALEANADWIKMPTFGEYIDDVAPMGRVYLPTASYEEMMEWSLPVESQQGYERFIARLKADGLYDGNKPYIRGGFWRNFMARYSESNLMNKKMLRVSRKVAEAQAAGTVVADGEALRDLYRSQCNCPYWHGLFGGLYLNYLRHAVYERMLSAESMVEAKAIEDGTLFNVELSDHDADGVDEVIVENPVINAIVSPHYGGAILELDYRPKKFNLTNVLTRRIEAYHAKIVAGIKPETSDGQPKSAHDIVKVKEQGLEAYLVNDPYDRRLFLDHFLGRDVTLDDFARADYDEDGDFVAQPYECLAAEQSGETINVQLARTAVVRSGEEWIPVRIEKEYAFGRGGAFTLTYTITNLGDRKIEVWFASEGNIGLLAGYADDRRYVVPGVKLEDSRPVSRGELDGVGEVRLEDDWSGVRLAFNLEPACGFWRLPIETVSQSEDGFERNYQASSLLFHWKLDLDPGAPERVTVRTNASHASG